MDILVRVWRPVLRTPVVLTCCRICFGPLTRGSRIRGRECLFYQLVGEHRDRILLCSLVQLLLGMNLVVIVAGYM